MSAHYPDPRQRGKVAFQAPTSSPLAAAASRIPIDLLLTLLLTKMAIASAALLARHWLLVPHSEHIHAPLNRSAASAIASARGEHSSTPWAIATTAFFFAALAQASWLRPWSWLPSLQRENPDSKALPKQLVTVAVVFFLHLFAWLMALQHLGALTVVAFTQFAEVWASDLARSLRSPSYGGYTVLLALALSFLWTLVTALSVSPSSREVSSRIAGDDVDLPDSLRHVRTGGLASPSSQRFVASTSAKAQIDAANFSPFGVLMGHTWLLIFAFLTLVKHRTTTEAAKSCGGRRRATVLAGILAASIALPLSTLASVFGFATLPPVRALIPYMSSSTTSHLPAYLLVALAFLILEPILSAILEEHASLQVRVGQGWPMAVLACAIVGFLAFDITVSWGMWAVTACVGYGLRCIIKNSPHLKTSFVQSSSSNGTTDRHIGCHLRQPSDDSALSDLFKTSKELFSAIRRVLKAILAKEDSKKIFQFLCLNLAFMGVQLAWGAWTNSLGLVSDAIHMFFDCAAIGMGLFASVMGTWGSDDVFTYGYGRVETLSGFANGVFLILVSIFIVFEAVQRIIDPPVMHNTRQLLIVSTMGLGVNLFGMFATGGHHHHGHGHHHHDHDHGHLHGRSHDHSHSHNMLGVYLHVMADTLGSVGVIISTLLIQYYGWTGFDPIASLFIAFMIVGSVVPLLVESGKILCLDLGSESIQNINEVLDSLLDEVKGLEGFSYARFWPKDGETMVGSIRLHLSCRVAEANGDAPGIDDVHNHASWKHASWTSSTASPSPSSGMQPRRIPLVRPEVLAAQVESLLKAKIAGLGQLSVQFDEAGATSAANSTFMTVSGPHSPPCDNDWRTNSAYISPRKSR